MRARPPRGYRESWRSIRPQEGSLDSSLRATQNRSQQVVEIMGHPSSQPLLIFEIGVAVYWRP